MDPIAVDIRLIRAMLGAELKIAPGRAMMARVLTADGSGRGKLTIAGAVIDAKLPKEVRAGDELRLVVRHVSPQQVVLSMSDQSQAAAAMVPVALPGGGTIRLQTDQEGSASGGGGAEGSHTLSLRYDAPALGAVDLRFELDSQSLAVVVGMAAGSATERGLDHADRLRQALTDGVGRPATVTITPRHEPLDLYA
jgi:hypothetical protein